MAEAAGTVAQSSPIGKTLAPKARKKAKPGTKALKEIRQYQKSTEMRGRKGSLSSPSPPFCAAAWTRSLYLGSTDGSCCALLLMNANEAYLVTQMEDANSQVIHAKRVTIKSNGVCISLRIKKEDRVDTDVVESLM